MRWSPIVGVALVPVLAAWLAANSAINKDEVRHFAYLHSLVFDRDLDFANEYTALDPKFARAPWYEPATNLPPNVSPIGPALLWLPAYLVVVALGLDPTGLGSASRAATVMTSSGLFSLAVCLSYGLMRRRAAHPALSVALVALGSFYLYWWVWPGQFGHAAAIGVSTLYVSMWSKSLDRHEARTWILLGALAGLVSIVRWQNAILPLLSLVWRWRRSGSFGRALVGTALFGIAALVVFLPQMMVWRVIYADWLTMPQGSFMHWEKPYLLDSLFSPRYGLFGFSPVLYVSIIGLVLGLIRPRDPLVQFAAVYVPLVVIVNASAGDWYGGATFGPRRMDSLFVFMVVGMAIGVDAFIGWVRRKPEATVVVVLVMCVGVTAVLAAGYRAGAINQGMVGAHEFPERASAAILRAVGWPPSLPAELYHMARNGTRLGQYSALASDDRLTWLDGVVAPIDRNLTGSWTSNEDGSVRLDSATGSLLIYLMDLGFHYRDIRVEFILRAPLEGGQLLALSAPGAIRFNGAILPGHLTPDGSGYRYRIDVPYAACRPGLNRVDFLTPGISLDRALLSRSN